VTPSPSPPPPPNPTRPGLLVVATGTGTHVGKTWWGAQTLAALRELGLRVAARKPVQSGTGERPTDADVLAAVTGEAPTAVCPPDRWLEPALAPPIAARQLGRRPCTIAELAAIDWPLPLDVGWVEGAGGVRSPLADDGDTVDLIELLHPELVVLVADAGLGAINAIRLAATAIGNRRIVVGLNRFDAADTAHVTNRDWLLSTDGFDVVSSPSELADRLTRRR